MKSLRVLDCWSVKRSNLKTPLLDELKFNLKSNTLVSDFCPIIIWTCFEETGLKKVTAFRLVWGHFFLCLKLVYGMVIATYPFFFYDYATCWCPCMYCSYIMFKEICKGQMWEVGICCISLAGSILDEKMIRVRFGSHIWSYQSDPVRLGHCRA